MRCIAIVQPHLWPRKIVNRKIWLLRHGIFIQWDITQEQKWNNAMCSNMDAPRDYQTKWSKPEKDKCIWYCLYEESKIKKKEKDTNELTDKTK